MKKYLRILIFFLSLFSPLIFSQQVLSEKEIENKIDSLISLMSLQEKVGQLVQIVGIRDDIEDFIRDGKVGSVLIGANNLEKANAIQKTAVEESRLGISLLIANDVIHGYKTIFPVPLGEASSWNPELIKEASSIAAYEAAEDGTNWTYAPMVDICRDPRWGRITEGSGEDPFLGSVLSAARVKGFQGDNPIDKFHIGACAKHYVAYGSAEGGRDYNTVDISERTLREIYLPPFKSAVDAGVLSIMSAFNDLNGIPASANSFTLKKILRDEWNFDGVVISDYNSIAELIFHRYAEDKKDAALKSFLAGVDIDMAGDFTTGNVYGPHLEELVTEGKISEELIDNSVKNVLRMKFRLNLFEDPYTNSDDFKNHNLQKEYKDSIALQLSRESIVLLKNEKNLLPLNKNIKSIALIGPLADNLEDLLGSWSAAGNPENVVTILQGIKNITGNNIKINFAEGCSIDDRDTSGFREAIEAAVNSDVAIIVAGESRDMSGEAASRTSLDLPGVQEELVKRIYETDKPVIVVLMNGRPLIINWIAENIPAVVEAWYLGNQAGNAIADVLFGNYNPSGKLPVTFPRSTGQIPIYYYQKHTGRPIQEEDKFTSKYLDSPNTPLFPFGFGLSYTKFEYKNLNISPESAGINDNFKVTVDVTNSGEVSGDEVVQLYVQDKIASITPPVKKLIGFQKIFLKPGEIKKVEFSITPDLLSFYDESMNKIVEPGEFIIMAGGNSVDLISKSFYINE